MKKEQCLSTIILSFLFLQGCNYDNRYCEIKIDSPTENQIFNSGDVVNVRATILDDGDAISREELLVISYHGNDTIINFEETKFTFKYVINQNFTADPNKSYKIEVRSIGGHGNLASESVNIKSN